MDILQEFLNRNQFIGIRGYKTSETERRLNAENDLHEYHLAEEYAEKHYGTSDIYAELPKTSDDDFFENRRLIVKSGDAWEYGFLEGSYVNVLVLKAVIEQLKREGKVLPIYGELAIFVGGRKQLNK